MKMIAYFMQNGKKQPGIGSSMCRATVDRLERSSFPNSVTKTAILPLDEKFIGFFKQKKVPFETEAQEELKELVENDYVDMMSTLGVENGFILYDFVSNSIQIGYKIILSEKSFS